LRDERRGIWGRLGIGAALIVLAAASATGVAAFHEIDKVVNAFEHGNTIDLPQELAQADTGKPQTMLLIGADQRAPGAADYNQGARSDTMMLVRLDPSKQATALMSLPRDLKVRIPGHGVAKLNEAYSEGGVKLTIKTIKLLTGLRINHVVNIDFRGFRKAINALHCVYVDVDRRYYNQSGAYAKIDLQAGYQEICGETALDYVRYRHTDNDIVRAARQQDFLRQMKQQIGVSRLIERRNKLIKIFGRYTQSDIGSEQAVLRLLRLVIDSASHPIREIHFTAKLGPSYVTASSTEVHRLAREFLGVGANAGTSSSERRSAKKRKSRSKSSRSSGLIDSSVMGKQMALQLVSGGSRGLRLYYPKALPPGASFIAPPRAYTIKSQSHRKFQAYRMVISIGSSTGQLGEYIGFQGLAWKTPPTLRSPTATKKIDGRVFLLFRDGSRTRLVAWRSDNAVYWVSNSLSESLSEKQLLSIAHAARPLG
jgi:polyisoprenyl-teichoic acid--peptidoglycan teichoic acid transferase